MRFCDWEEAEEKEEEEEEEEEDEHFLLFRMWVVWSRRKALHQVSSTASCMLTVHALNDRMLVANCATCCLCERGVPPVAELSTDLLAARDFLGGDPSSSDGLALAGLLADVDDRFLSSKLVSCSNTSCSSAAR